MSTIESEYNESLHQLQHAAEELHQAEQRFKEAKAKFQHLDNEFKAHKDALSLEAEIAWSRKIKNPDF